MNGTRVELASGGAFIISTEAGTGRLDRVNIRVRSKLGGTVLLLTPTPFELREIVAALSARIPRGADVLSEMARLMVGPADEVRR